MSIRTVLSACLLWLFAASAWSCELPADYVPVSERSNNALLFKLSGCGIKDSYVFGTYHSDSLKLKPIINHLTPYLLQSKHLWLETVSTPQNNARMQHYLSLPLGSPNLEQLVGTALFRKTVRLIGTRLKLSEQAIQRLRPWALALLVQYPEPESDGIILDARLQQVAQRKGIAVHSLETLEEQFSIFTDMPKQMQVDFLGSTLADFEDIHETLDTLSQHYLRGDIEAIYQQSENLFVQMEKDYPALAQHLRSRLIESRNHKMAETILKKAGNQSFIAIGALHLPGETGVLRLLENDGIQLTPIPMAAK